MTVLSYINLTILFGEKRSITGLITLKIKNLEKYRELFNELQSIDCPKLKNIDILFFQILFKYIF